MRASTLYAINEEADYIERGILATIEDTDIDADDSPRCAAPDAREAI